MPLDEGQRLLRAVLLHGDRRLGMDGVRGILQRGAAVIHAELAIGRSIEHVAVVGEDRVLDPHQLEDALHLADVADGVAVEAADEVDLVVRLALQLRRGAGLAIPEVIKDALQGIVVAGHVAADEGRRVGERNVVLGGNRALLLGGLDEGVEVVADHLRHAGGGNRDHLGLVHVVGICEPVDHVVQAAEDGRVLGHRGRYAGARLLEVARQMAAVVGDAALRAMHEGQRTLETDGHEHRPQRLAGLGRVDRQRLAGKILLAIFGRLGPFSDTLDLRRIVRILEQRFLVGQHLLVFRTAEQLEVIEHVFGILCHRGTLI